MQKKIPMRQCLGCREMRPKRDLLRIVHGTDGTICADPSGKLQGRGAYLCKNSECIHRALKNKSIEKAFSAPVPADLAGVLLTFAEEEHD